MQQVPAQFKQPVTLSNYLEAMSKAGFQAGISWQVVEKKWAYIRENMKGFDPLKVSRFTGVDIDGFMQDERMIRNRKKLEGVVLNARRLLELDKEYKGFRNYLRAQGPFEKTVAALHREFKFLGETGAYYFLYVVQEKTPPHEEWMAAHAQEW
jgi:3-methyladenine DNA glycosylase Tag